MVLRVRVRVRVRFRVRDGTSTFQVCVLLRAANPYLNLSLNLWF